MQSLLEKYSWNTPRVIIFLLSCLALQACNEGRPNGSVFQMNGAGVTLPVSGAEVAFLPGTTRADFFYEPLSEAYQYATANLGEELAPICLDASSALTELQLQNSNDKNQLLTLGNVPKTPDACFTMCTQRLGLEQQRAADRERLSTEIEDINGRVAAIKKEISSLQAARTARSGKLGEQLQALKASRRKEIQKRVGVLATQLVGRIKLTITEPYDSYRGGKVGVRLTNATDYALTSRQYNFSRETDFILEGYYQGVKITETNEVRIPHYGFRATTLRDQFGFDLGYLVPPGGSVPLGESIYDLPALSVTSPSGKLLVAERGWTPKGGYIFPDEFRIKSFPLELFVTPDTKGKRAGDVITYSPKQVDLEAEAVAQGLPQDAEIARLNIRINNESFPEDAEIESKRRLIAKLEAEKKELSGNFAISAEALQISELIEDEQSCRDSRDLFAGFESVSKELAAIEASLSSCTSNILNSSEILNGIRSLNNSFDTEIEVPDISAIYGAKASELILLKMAASAGETTLTSNSGDFYIPDSVNVADSMAFVQWETNIGQSFWLQPLNVFEERKYLSYSLSETGTFEDYLEKVITFGSGVTSSEELNDVFTIVGLEAKTPFPLQSELNGMAASVRAILAQLERADAVDDEEPDSLAIDVPVACEL